MKDPVAAVLYGLENKHVQKYVFPKDNERCHTWINALRERSEVRRQLNNNVSFDFL